MRIFDFFSTDSTINIYNIFELPARTLISNLFIFEFSRQGLTVFIFAKFAVTKLRIYLSR